MTGCLHRPYGGGPDLRSEASRALAPVDRPIQPLNAGTHQRASLSQGGSVGSESRARDKGGC
jgi:hypothetical protein